MKNQLDEMLGSEVQPVEEADPLSHLIGKAAENVDVDPFMSILDGMLAEKGLDLNSETSPKTEGYETHEWELKSTLVFADDEVEAICKKCFRQMKMSRESTWNEAMTEHEVNPNCGMVIADSIMSS
jgi:hypothetical protein